MKQLQQIKSGKALLSIQKYLPATRGTYARQFVRIVAMGMLTLFLPWPSASAAGLADRVKRIAKRAGDATAAANPLAATRIVALTPDGLSHAIRDLPNASGPGHGDVVLAALIRGEPATAATTLEGAPRYTLPILVNSQLGDLSTDSQPVIELVEKGLHYIAARHEFEVTALVGLASAGGGASVPLPREVVFLISAPVDDVNPPQVTITHVNPPYVPVVLRVANPTDNMTLELTALGQRAPPVSLAVRRPKLIISAAPSRILGWGLESASINVQVEETGDGKLPPIILSNDRGRLEISTLVLGGGNVATTRLFSTGLKGAKITSSSFPVAIVTAANVEFAFPFAFTISLVIGGLVGAWISQRSFTGSLVAGVGVGLIVGVLYVFGVNLLKLQIDAPHASEAVGFVLSALGGFFGPKLLELLKPTPAQPIGDTAS